MSPAISTIAPAPPAGAAPATASTVAVYAERALTRASLAALLRGHAIDVITPLEPAQLDAAPLGLWGPSFDVILLASPAPDAELTQRLVREQRAPLLLLLDRPLAPNLRSALGAQGAVCRECPPEQLLRAIGALAAGTSFFECAGHRPLGPPAPAAPLLSARERRVAAELAGGAQAEEIASALCISPHTARTHVRNIRRKLGARTSAQAVAVAITMGLVGPPGA